MIEQPKDYPDETYQLKDIDDEKRYTMTIRVPLERPIRIETVCKMILNGEIPISDLNISNNKNGAYYE